MRMCVYIFIFIYIYIYTHMHNVLGPWRSRRSRTRGPRKHGRHSNVHVCMSVCLSVCCYCCAPICEQRMVTRSPKQNRRIGPWPRMRVPNPALIIGRHIQISIFDTRSTREATSIFSTSYQALAYNQYRLTEAPTWQTAHVKGIQRTLKSPASLIRH